MSKTDLVGEMYGERAIQAPFGLVLTRAPAANGIPRAMIGGVIFTDCGTDHWERWCGTAILIPQSIDKTRKACSWNVQQLMTSGLQLDPTEEEMKFKESFWKKVWRE